MESAVCPSCSNQGEKVRREVDTLDTFFDSSWYFLRYLDPQNKDVAFTKDMVQKWMPVDIYVGGMEHAIMHLLYARFVHKFLCDMHGIEDPKLREPFKELIVQGLVKAKTFEHAITGERLSEEEAMKLGPTERKILF
jgi:leucyl-tRNA synthetase